MSWFKKLFKVFKNEEDEYIEDSFHNHDRVSSWKENSNEGHKDIDAKVLYQYPKGQFRFPLIPDNEIRERREKRVQERHIERPKVRERPQKPKIEATPLSSTEKPKKHEPKKTVKQEYSRRPFRPTEIPSPIYGYDRKPKKTDMVEYELHAFTEKALRDDHLKSVKKTLLEEDTIPFQSPFVGEDITQSEKFEHEPVEASLAIDSAPTFYELEKQETLADVETIEEHIEVPASEQAEKLILEQVELPEQAENQELEQVELPEQTEKLELERIGLLEQAEELPQEQVDQQEEIDEPTLEQIEESKQVEEPEQGQVEQLEKVEEVMQKTVEQQAQIEEPEQEPVEQIDQVDELTKEQPEQPMNKSNEEPILEIVKPEKKRSHIPFNVIMLKEDKRKLERKAEKRILKDEEPQDQTNLFIAQAEVSATAQETVFEEQIEEVEPYYVFPSMDMLKPPVIKNVNTDWLQGQEELLNETLLNFNVQARVAHVTQGPSVTRFEVRPDPGVKVNKITNLSDDIKLSLAARDIRMEAPIPGTHMIGIEVPNESSRPVFISEIIKSDEFLQNSSPLTAALGLDISGKPIVTDLRKMPHGLIAGATGSGKSVCINSILVSILYKANPNEVKLMLIDPKMVELAPYNQIPHLVSPVITDVKAATAALKWAVDEMEHRYELFAHAGVRDIARFNETAHNQGSYAEKLPYIVIVIDELADLMMMSPADVEEAICRIAQKARACGIHLIIATQRPSVDVITGLIKANVPTRIAFSVSSQVDSRTIIDISGAEKLLGRGDMLFLENGSSKPVRLQGTFVSDEEIDAVVAHVRREQSPQYLFEQEELLKKANIGEEEDELFYEACEFIIDQGGASTSSLQRKFKIGYNRAARLIDMMEELGLISESRGSKPRDVLMTESELESMHDNGL